MSAFLWIYSMWLRWHFTLKAPNDWTVLSPEIPLVARVNPQTSASSLLCRLNCCVLNLHWRSGHMWCRGNHLVPNWLRPELEMCVWMCKAPPTRIRLLSWYSKMTHWISLRTSNQIEARTEEEDVCFPSEAPCCKVMTLDGADCLLCCFSTVLMPCNNIGTSHLELCHRERMVIFGVWFWISSALRQLRLCLRLHSEFFSQTQTSQSWDGIPKSFRCQKKKKVRF